MEKGFYHPSIGYWQTISEPSQEILTSYPEGTVEVGLPPTPSHRYENGQWVEVLPAPPTPEETDAMRRGAYRNEADPLFFKYQRGEATREEWLAKVDEIRARYP